MSGSGLGRYDALRVVQVSFYLDPARRQPDALLRDWPTLGGVAAAVAHAGIDCSVVQAAWCDASVTDGGATIEFVAPEWTGVPIRRGRRLRLPSRRVAAAVRRRRPDVVHVHGLAFPLATRHLRRVLGDVPILAQDHADHPRRGWRRLLQRWGLASVSGVAFTARAQAARFVDEGVLRADVPVFEVLESSSRFVPGDQQTARLRTGLVGDPCLLWLGNLDANKDPITVLEAVRRVAPRLPGVRLFCCFRAAPLRASVERRLNDDPALGDRVTLLGARRHEEVEDLLRAADFLIQGSHSEGSGYAVIEALACGTTPLATDIPSLRRITDHGRVGALTPPGNPEAMADGLVRWASRDRRRLRTEARSHFDRHLSFAAVARELRAAYEALRRRP